MVHTYYMANEETLVQPDSIEEKEAPLDKDLQEMMKAGLHFGHRTSKTHPRMKPYVSGIRNMVHIIDLKQTKEKLEDIDILL